MSKEQIRVSHVPSDRVPFIKALRLVGQLGLKQANDLAVHLERFRNSVLVAGIDPAVAGHVSEVLRASGAEVVVEPCSINTPMLCSPAANAKYQWGRFRLVKKAV